MAILDDRGLKSSAGFEVFRPVGRRVITHAIHDIDGTHSIIRDWPPVMSLSIHYAMTSGLPEDFDSEENARRLIEETGKKPLPETDRFCVESAGLSALTQMEFGIRRAVELGNIPVSAGIRLTPEAQQNNSLIIRRMWEGEERFQDIPEPESLKRFIADKTPRLFKLYERVLNGACRDRNTADAWKNPTRWRVKGSYEFVSRLHQIGVKNYFVTGAVVYPEGGMYEEVLSLGFEIGAGKIIEAMEGSSWDRKMPKDEVMRELFGRLRVEPAHALVVGDGRTEMKAGTDMGCVTISRLPRAAARLREMHKAFGVNYIVEDYTDVMTADWITA
jgi:phosphoglycolate phosphatase-like HAD superfamily hydrolase